MKIRTIQVFLIFTVIHSAIFLVLPLSFSEYNDRVNWFAINAIPWWPLYKLGLPVTHTDWLMRPNGLGWLWCVLVWSVFYYVLARIVASRRSRNQSS